MINQAGESPPVLFNDFVGLWELIRTTALQAIDRVGRSGWFILGEEVAAFEEALANRFGHRHAVGCASGLDAIEIAIRAAGLAPGSRILTTPLSAFATTLAIVRAHCVPIFVDVDDCGLLDLNHVEELLATDEQIQGLVPVHLFGHALDLDRLAMLKERHNLTVVEDCAQAVGARSGNRTVGSVGQAAALSLYPTKNLGALGDGGAVLTSDPGIAAAARALRDYGQSGKYTHTLLGLNSRLDELHAAVLRDAMLPLLDLWTARRSEIARRYSHEIANPSICTPMPPTQSSSVWHLFPILVPDHRDALRTYLADVGIQSAVHYPIIIPDQTALRAYPGVEVHGELRFAQHYARSELSLPIHPLLTDSDVTRVIAALNAWSR